MNITNFTPSFCGYKSEFSKKLEDYIASPINEKISETNLIGSFQDVLNRGMNIENEKGRGFHGIVYGIDDYYVFKVDKANGANIGNVKIEKNDLIENLKTYFGAIIAKIGNIEIIKNAFKTDDVLVAGIPHTKVEPENFRDYYNNIYLKRFAVVPQNAYDKIAGDFKELNKAGKEFDTINPNNFVLDGNTIKIIDDITDAEGPSANNLAKLFRVFTNSYDANTIAEFDYSALGRRKELFKKLILASERAELPFGWSNKDRNELNLAMELCGYNEDFGEIQRTLMDYRRRYPDIETRLQKVAEYLEEFDEPDIYTAMFYN